MKNIILAILLLKTTFLFGQKDFIFFHKESFNKPISANNSFVVDSSKIIISGLDISSSNSLECLNQLNVINKTKPYVLKKHTFSPTNNLDFIVYKFDNVFKIYDINNKEINKVCSNTSINYFQFIKPNLAYGVKNYFIQYNELNESNVLYKTLDSGKTWNNIFDFNILDKNQKHRIDYINFTDENKGFIFLVQYNEHETFEHGGYENQSNILLKTENGGKSWVICKLPNKYYINSNNNNGVITYKLTNIYFVDKYEGFMLTENYNEMLITNNGGKDWFIKAINIYNDNEKIINKYYSVDKKTYYPFVLHKINSDLIKGF